MKLLGSYNSKLQAFHYQELLDLYKAAIATGEFSGNDTFNTKAISTLISQSEDFATLPVASANQRVTDESINTPANLLAARFGALLSEAEDFEARAAALIGVLERDTVLLDQLLAGANLKDWVAGQPKLTGATSFSWDFGMGEGISSDQISKVDPTNDVLYPSQCLTNTYLDVVDADRFEGLVAPEKLDIIDAKNLQWSWIPATEAEQAEDIYGDKWAQLNLLEENPLVNFLPDPLIQTILPSGGSISGIFNISGSTKNGALPVYVKTVFAPRRSSVMLAPVNSIQNPGFEAGATIWTIEPPMSVQSGGDSHGGTKHILKGTLPTWSSVITYSVNDEVFFNNQEWRSISAGNINNTPGAPGVSVWVMSGRLISNAFSLHPQNKVYVETWVKNISANGTMNIALSCRDSSDNEISPAILIPGVTSANDWTQVASTLTALADPAVVSGRIIITFKGHTAGNWLLDDFRVHLPMNLSQFSVNQDDVSVYIPKVNGQPVTIFFQDEHFVIDDISNITFMGLDDAITYTVRFTENFPGYQCSINEKVFSPLIMMDPNRPYPDTEKLFNPIEIGLDSSNRRTLFPITDETGVPNGLTIQVVGRPMFEYYFQISTPGQPQAGATAVLEIDLSSPAYLNGVSLAPFSAFPMRLSKVEIEPFITDTRQILGTPNTLIDRPLALTFPTTLLRKIFLTCHQESYNLTEHVVKPTDSLRRDTLASVQSVLPFNIHRAGKTVPVFFRGAQYAFGLEDIAGLAATPVLPGVFISGPYHFGFAPEVFRFDADIFDPNSINTSNVYLCWIAYNSAGLIIDQELSGVMINQGACEIWPFASLSLLDRGNIHNIDIFLKFVIRDKNAVVQRFLLQVRGTNV